MNILLKVSYDGTDFHGYQIQPNVRTCEGVLRDAISETLKSDVEIFSAGRTDRGVHAMGQCVNFYSDTTIDIGNLPKVINYHLPDDISVVGARYVDDDFHARFSAKGKFYRYVINSTKYRNPIYRNRAYECDYELDLEKMDRALQKIVGLNDFKTFMGRYAIVKDTIRRIYRIEVSRDGNFIYIDYYGKSFLKNMIRIITGTAIEIGRGRFDEDFLLDAMHSKKRIAAGPTAPAHGLYLMRIFY